jgi:hypothetical protein
VATYGLSDLQPVLNLALHTGNADALRFAFRLLAETDPGQSQGADNWGLAEVFRENIKLAGVNDADGLDNHHLFERLRHYSPDSFRFDPVRHHFVLKSGASTSLAMARNP